MTELAGIVVSVTGIYLVGLAMVSFLTPSLSERFLNGYASSAGAHYVEQAARMVAGVALVLFAPAMYNTEIFRAFGWIIIVTTAGLLLTPWQWHHGFAQWAIPLAIRNLKAFAVGALLLGVFVLFGVSRAVLD